MIAAAYNQHTAYLQALSYFSARLKNQTLRDSLINAKTEDEVYKLLTETDDKMSPVKMPLTGAAPYSPFHV
jgi:mannitol/fructose-specific phosphotransferase system IIA component (Ntr-type)